MDITYILVYKTSLFMAGGNIMKGKYMQDQYYIAVFDSRSHAIQLYNYLRKNRFYQFQLISTPCKIKAGCSYSIKFNNLEDHNILVDESNKIRKVISSIYMVQRINKNRVLKKLDII